MSDSARGKASDWPVRRGRRGGKKSLAKPDAEFVRLRKGAELAQGMFGARAERLLRLANLELPVPEAIAISVDAVRRIAAGRMPDAGALLAAFGETPLLAVRSSPGMADWGRAQTILHVGMNFDSLKQLEPRMGEAAALELYAKFVVEYSVEVARLDPEAFDDRSERSDPSEQLDAALSVYESDVGAPFPQSVEVQLGNALRAIAQAWEGTSARMLRRASGAPDDAGLGLVVQEAATALAKGENGSGSLSSAHPRTGAAGLFGHYASVAHGRIEVGIGAGMEMEGQIRQVLEDASLCLAKLRESEHDACEIEFGVSGGGLRLLDYGPAPRSAAAEIGIAVGLAKDGAITKRRALTRIEPDSLGRILHRQVNPLHGHAVLARGVGASPGAASGAMVFSAAAAEACAARGGSCILVRVETGPEDIRSMYFAKAVLTGRGGATSHAAVIARGLGVPCVAGASDLHFDQRGQALVLTDGRSLGEGDVITVDGTRGEVLEGAVPLVESAVNDEIVEFLGWADIERDVAVRANADTAAEVRAARSFGAEGIGLCRTEHMFFGETRLTVMRELIFADSDEERRSALDQLLGMQRSDFISMFEIMKGWPVCIRLFDPPLHEFLPHDRDEIQDLAGALGQPVSKVVARAEELREFNPMLGLRGVRLGVTVPEIYEMQARAIFEATAEANRRGDSVVPEIMVPLVSAHREMELVRQRVDAVARSVRNESGTDFEYSIGVMVETPRAALRAGDLAKDSSFLSFGTNDLTQMTYGISRDDSPRFMAAYLAQGVFPQDPFSSLDHEGVGELLLTAAERGRASRRDLVLAICGEHGGDPSSIAFCRNAGFDYVSCSPFRVPIARLAAAQAAIRASEAA